MFFKEATEFLKEQKFTFDSISLTNSCFSNKKYEIRLFGDEDFITLDKDNEVSLLIIFDNFKNETNSYSKNLSILLLKSILSNKNFEFFYDEIITKNY